MNSLFIPQKPCGLPIKEAVKLQPELRKYITNGKLDLGNTQALLLYNQSILREFLGLKFNLPSGFLIPTICSRWNFVSWILTKAKPISVLEVGTGASAILALMMAKIGCIIHATEINTIAFNSALNNIKLNGFISEISLKKVEGNEIVKGIYNSLNIFDAIICNPPQYDEEYFKSQKASKRGFIGQESELVGGINGYEFIIKLIEEIQSFNYSNSLFFQITSLKIEPFLQSFLEYNNYEYIKDEIKIGTRLRYYFQIKF